MFLRMLKLFSLLSSIGVKTRKCRAPVDQDYWLSCLAPANWRLACVLRFSLRAIIHQPMMAKITTTDFANFMHTYKRRVASAKAARKII